MLIAKVHSSLAVHHLPSSCIVDAAQPCARLQARRASPVMPLMQTAPITPATSQQSQLSGAAWRRACTYLHAEREAKRVPSSVLLSACAKVLKWQWNHLPVQVPGVRRPWNSRPHHLLPRWIPCLKLHTLATANGLRLPVINWRNWFVWGLSRGGGIFFLFSSYFRAAFLSGLAACW